MSRVRRAYALKRVGHGGTLDPAVTGVLPMALGPATRLLPYLPGEKAYRASLQLGLRTRTDDLQGEALQPLSLPISLSLRDLEAALTGFRGRIAQRPPAFSAVHVQGERAYALARRGETPELASRQVTMHRLELLDWDPQLGRLELEIHCSAGTYIRALARDLGESLGCGGALASLRRTAALGFHLHQSVSVEALGAAPPASLPPLLDPLEVLTDLPRHQLTGEDCPRWRCGQAQEPRQAWPAGSAVLVIGPDGKLAGLAIVQPTGLLQPRLVFSATG